VDRLAEYAPAIEELIVGHEVLTPQDLQNRYGVTNGHLYHGEHAPDQLLVRPFTSCARYATPFDGLFLCGGGTHPGGGVTCGPGSLAADVILAGS
jgi:phytoene dehydrogenase-like protein